MVILLYLLVFGWVVVFWCIWVNFGFWREFLVFWMVLSFALLVWLVSLGFLGFSFGVLWLFAVAWIGI